MSAQRSAVEHAHHGRRIAGARDVARGDRSFDGGEIFGREHDIERAERIHRTPLVSGGHVCLYDPRFAKIRTLTEDHLLWPQATDDDDPCRYVREKIQLVARTLADGRDLIAVQ